VVKPAPEQIYERYDLGGAEVVEHAVVAHRLGAWDLPATRFRARLEAVAWWSFEPPRIDAVRWSEKKLREQLTRFGGVPVVGIDIVEREPLAPEARPYVDDDHDLEALRVEVDAEPLPPAFVPYRLFPQRPGERSFDEVLAEIARETPACLTGVHEGETFWAFRVAFWIGCCGFVVRRREPGIVRFGSLGGFEDWVLAYEEGVFHADSGDEIHRIIHERSVLRRTRDGSS
jgi:hypothetical protein